MLPIKAEGHAAGQQLNVRLSAQHVFSNGINCYSNQASLEGPVHTYSILSHREGFQAAASSSPALLQVANHSATSWHNPKAITSENYM